MSGWAQAANDLDNLNGGGDSGGKPAHRVSFSNVDQFSDGGTATSPPSGAAYPPARQGEPAASGVGDYTAGNGEYRSGNNAPVAQPAYDDNNGGRGEGDQRPAFGNVQTQQADAAGNMHYLDSNPSNLYNIHLDDSNTASLIPFSSFGLKKNLLKGIYQMGFNTPSKIQETCIPLLTKNPPQNMIAQSQSGTGKTATFVITMMERVDTSNPHTQCICIAPTFELVLQIGTVCEQMSKYMGITIGYALRGVGVVPAANEPLLSQVVIATPGKLLEYCFKRQCIKLDDIKVCVLDEADVMIDQQGHRDQTIRVVSKLPPTTQMLLFSATFNERVSKFATTVVPRAHTLKLRRSQESLDNISQFYFYCNNIEDKFRALLNIYRTISLGQAMIFCQTRKTATWLTNKLAENNLSCALLSGELDVSERASIIERFRSARERILVTTNVSARGIDVEQVTMVVNFDMPVIYDSKQADCETYLHRIGRTGRFGKMGIAINMIDGPRSLEIQNQIIQHFNVNILPLEIDDLDAIQRIEPNFIPN